ncbi:MAG: TIGR02677 family protein [Gemmatimonadota bacterium]
MPAPDLDLDDPTPDVGTPPLDPSIPRRVEEAAYLTAPNAGRYRVVVHFFYQQYVEQRDWLTVEQVWHHMREHFDSGYTLERCEDDLRALVGWQNLMAEQDRSRVSTLDEWHHRRQVYHITAVTIELEAALERLRAAHGRRGSLDSSLIEMLVADLHGLDRLFAGGVAATPAKEFVAAKVRRPWLDAFGRFEELRTNANRFHHALRETRPEDLTDTSAFFLYKDVLIDNLSGFIVELGDTVDRIRDILQRWDRDGVTERLVDLLVDHDVRYQADPTGPADPDRVRRHYERQMGVLREWFRRRGGSDVLRRTTMHAIETVARHTQRLTDPRRLGSNRRQELERLAQAFRACETLDQAHLLAARTLGCAVPRHLLGHAEWHLMGDGASVWEQPVSRVALAPIRRGPRRATSRRPVADRSLEQAALLEEERERIREEAERWNRLFGGGEIDVGDLTLDDPAVRDRVLDVLGGCLVAPRQVGVASDGSRVRLEAPASDEAYGELVAPDGVFVTPRYRLRRVGGADAP